MNYNIKGTGMEITPELRAYVDAKLAHAEKFVQWGSPVQTDVELEFLSGEADRGYRAEFNLRVAGEFLRAEARGGAMHEAIDLAADELVQELRKAKDKHVGRVRRSASRVKDFIKGLRR